ncbi:hypothetical protein HID58_061663 [Brassica napus]|uniref:Uncharacterized protein n=1 Tax=Brassica napus TaxID=3708 RepID=A0ABQ7ZZ84_BRANA|nr:hypothetical protein HID58_061663 [Brassica napus]
MLCSRCHNYHRHDASCYSSLQCSGCSHYLSHGKYFLQQKFVCILVLFPEI